MKQSTFIALLLTLLSALLVLSATIFFLFQGRQQLMRDVARLESDARALRQTVTGLEESLNERSLDLALAEANNELLTDELAAREITIGVLEENAAEMQEELEQLEATVAAAAAREAAQQDAPPLLEIFYPEDGAIMAPGDTVAIIASASHPAGILSLDLTLNGEALESYDAQEVPLYTANHLWPAGDEGEYLLAATATGVNGRASEPISITINVIDFESINAQIRRQVEENVVQIRGLEPLRPVEPTLLTSEELRQRLEEDLLSEVDEEQSRRDAIVLSAFDFIEPNFDLRAFFVDLYSEQVAGFYDPETGEFVVISDGGELGTLEQWTHAHEFVHALQDQHFDLSLLSDDSADGDARLALRALAEGDATLVQVLYLELFSQSELMRLFRALSDMDSTILDSAPPIFEASLGFPYTAGFEFVETLYNQGGFAAVNAAWLNPPQSTEHILHPDRYLAGDLPISVSLTPLTDTLGAGWQLLDEDVLGEFYLREYLKQQLNSQQVDRAATGWGGDRYAVYWHEANEELVMVLYSAWDSAADSNEFINAYITFATNRAGVNGQPQADGGICWLADDIVCLYQQLESTLVVRAPDLATAQNIAVLQLELLPAEAGG